MLFATSYTFNSNFNFLNSNDSFFRNKIGEVESKIFDFFTEDSIIARTKDCDKYFRKFVPIITQPATPSNVSLEEF